MVWFPSLSIASSNFPLQACVVWMCHFLSTLYVKLQNVNINEIIKDKDT